MMANVETLHILFIAMLHMSRNRADRTESGALSVSPDPTPVLGHANMVISALDLRIAVCTPAEIEQKPSESIHSFTAHPNGECCPSLDQYPTPLTLSDD
jgi:hypothetical protein